MRFRTRHLHRTIYDLVRDYLDDNGWLEAPVNFGTTPVTLLDFEPQDAGVVIAPNTVAVSLGDSPGDEEWELGGLMVARYAVFVDIYPSEESIGVAIADDVRDLLFDTVTSLRDYTTDPDGVATEISIEFEHVLAELIPAASSSLDKRAWRSVKATAVLYI